MTNKIEASLLGGISFTVDGLAITTMPARVGQALLIYILLQPNPITRSHLVGLFFSENEDAQARANLRATLSRIKKQVGNVLDANRNEVWVRDGVEVVVDARMFSKSLRKQSTDNRQQTTFNKATSRNTHHASPSASLQTTLNLYTGDFLPTFYLSNAPGFEQWLLIERERLRLLAIGGFQELIKLLKESAEFATALDYTNRLLAIEPLLEQTQRDKLILLTRSGQREQALRHYRTVVALFEEELGVELSAETQTLHTRIRNLPDSPANNLPSQRSQFIGRAAELAQLRQLLSDQQQRAITLLGPGGMGKTALSLTFAHHLLADQPGLFLDGIYFISLETITTAGQLPLTISNTIGLTLSGERSVIEQLLNHLKTRETLLILDNFESVNDDGAAILADILSQTNDVKLLITSRERLHIYEETIIDLGGLATPPAVDLFVTRARRLQQQFDATADADPILKSCQLLEGMPLAIELAAAWVRDYPCTEIAAKIASGIDFLRTRMHNVPTRQRSLRAIFDQSWALLSAEQQTALAALSIFPADFTAEAAAAVADVDNGVLVALSDRSLVQQLADGRLRVHAMIRQFSADFRPTPNSLATRHSTHYVEQIAHLAETFLDRSAFTEIRSDLPNLYAAWTHSLDQSTWVNLHTLIRPLFEYYNWSGHWQNGVSLIETTLDALPDQQVSLRALLYARLNRLHAFLSRLADADAAAQAAVPLFEQIDEKAEESSLYGNWSRAKTLRGEFAEAVRLADKGLVLGISAEDNEAIAYNHSLLGTAHKALGNYAAAGKHMQAALDIRHNQNDVLGEAITLNNYGNLLRDQGTYTEALATYSQATAIFRELEHDHGTATTLSNAAIAAGNLKQFDESERLQNESLTIKRRLGNPRSIALSLAALADARTFQAHFDSALAALREGLTLSLTADSEWAVDEIFASWADWFIEQQQHAAAAPLLAWLQAREDTRPPVKERANRLITLLPANIPLPDPPPTRNSLIATLP